MFVKVLFLILFFAVMIGVGPYSRKHASRVDQKIALPIAPTDHSKKKR
uniref:Uncharacterized protein n=1 Tax=Eubacterium plexicaudatum ASF492 TaxID=1235802 RepID=N2A3M2_9FIRM